MKRSKLLLPFVATLAGIVLLAAIASFAGAGMRSGSHGRVFGLDQNGRPVGPVSGARIELRDQTGQLVAETTSADAGYYRLDVGPRRYTYRVTAAGFRDEDAGRGIVLERSDGYAVFNFSLTRGENDPNRKPPEISTSDVGDLLGRVLYKNDKGKLVGLPGAHVSLVGPNGKRALTQLVTRAQDRKTGRGAGGYNDTLAVGEWRASVAANGFETLVEQPPLEIVAAQPTIHDFVLKRERLPKIRDQGITVRVTVDDPKTDANALPKPQVYVMAMPTAADPGKPLIGDDSGLYQRDLPEGLYRVVAIAEGYVPVRSSPTDVLRGKYSLVDLRIGRKLNRKPPEDVDAQGIRGVVKILDPLASPAKLTAALATVKVYIAPDPSSSPLANPKSLDRQGRFEKALPPGRYKVVALAKGFRPASVVSRTLPGQYADVELTLRRKVDSKLPSDPLVFDATVVEQIADSETRRPLADAAVFLRGPNESLSDAARAMTDSRGKVQFKVSEAGEYIVLARKSNYAPGGARVTIRGGGRNRLEITLVRRESEKMPVVRDPAEKPSDKPTGKPADRPTNGIVTVRGFVVTDVAGRRMAVPDARLSWTTAGGQTLPSVTVAQRGQFAITLKPGNYAVTVQPPAGFNGEGRHVRVAAGMQPLYFVLTRQASKPITPALARLEVRVLESATRGVPRPVSGATVSIFQRNRAIATERSNTLGIVSLSLKPGQYEIRTAHTGFTSERGILQINSDPVRRDIYLRRVARQPVLATLNVQVGGTSPRGGNRVTLLRGARVTITQNGLPVTSGMTDVGGGFRARLKPGNYDVVASYLAYETGRSRVTLRGPMTNHRVLLNPVRGSATSTQKNAVLDVQVGGVNPQGGNRLLLLRGANVTVTQNGRRITSGVTNAAGTFSMQLAPGVYRIEATYQNYYPAGTSVTVSAGRASKRLLLKPRRTIK